MMIKSIVDVIKYNSDGLVPVIAQENETGDILMVAWMNKEALTLTIEQKQAVYWSRSRQELWRKGDTSGHTQAVVDIRLDCDNDVLLLTVVQQGGIACHTGRHSCFYQQLTKSGWKTVESVPNVGANNAVLDTLAAIIQQRKLAGSDTSYVASLYAKGLNKILEKVGEECVETIIAAKDAHALPTDDTHKQALVYETADLWFHSLVMLGHFNISPSEVLNELSRRFNMSGLAEKAARKTD